jgi:hypothetical protein
MYLNKALSHELQYCFSHCFTDMSESHLAAIGRGGVIKDRFSVKNTIIKNDLRNSSRN